MFLNENLYFFTKWKRGMIKNVVVLSDVTNKNKYKNRVSETQKVEKGGKKNKILGV